MTQRFDEDQGGYNVGHMHTVVDPDNGRGFVIRYVTLAIVLCILAYSVGFLRGWALATTTVVFAALLLIGYGALALVDSRQFLSLVSTLLNARLERRRMEALERLHMARIESRRVEAIQTARLRLATDRSIAKQATVQPQSHSNRLVGYVDADPEPMQDTLREELLTYLCGLYEEDRLNQDGRIAKTSPPWSKRGSFSPTDKERAEKLLLLAANANGAWVCRYDADRRGYYLNIARFQNPAQLVRAFDGIATPARS